MADDKPKNMETEPHAAIRPRTGSDVLSSFIGIAASPTNKGHRLELNVRTFDFETLSDSANYQNLVKFCQERGGTVYEVINDIWGKAWATKPRYEKAATEADLERVQAEGQKALDEYKLGTRATGKTAETKAKAKIGDETSKLAESVGMTTEEFLALMREQAAKKAKAKK